MKGISRAVGLITMLAGFGIAGWAPQAFVAVSGRALPLPRPEDAAAMAVWSGVAFVRAFGAVLLGFGAVLWATARRSQDDRGVHWVLFASAVFATLIILAQQVAIWSRPAGFALVAIFGLIAITTGVEAVRMTRKNFYR